MKALDLRKKSFAIYGLGATGKSIINYFNRKKFKNPLKFYQKLKNPLKFRQKKYKNPLKILIINF